jgi:hypothetical protein
LQKWRPRTFRSLEGQAGEEGQVAEAVYITVMLAFFNRVDWCFGVPSQAYLEKEKMTPQARIAFRKAYAEPGYTFSVSFRPQQDCNLSLKDGHVGRAHVFGVDAAVAVDHERDRQA